MKRGNQQPGNKAEASAKRRRKEGKVLKDVWNMQYGGACTVVTYDLVEEQGGMALAGRSVAADRPSNPPAGLNKPGDFSGVLGHPV